MIKYILAYFCAILSWMFIFLHILVWNDYINMTHGEMRFITYFIVFPLAYIYHKFKPMPFKNVLEKYLHIKLPSWEDLKYGFMILLGTDKEYLKKDKDFNKSRDKENNQL